MCFNLPVWMQVTSELKFGQLANVQTVGIGLYLALAVIQGISATGVAALRRRTTTLRAAVLGARLRSELTNVRRLHASVSRLEIGFHFLNRTLLWLIFGLFSVALFYFAYSTIVQDSVAPVSAVQFVLAYYLVLPLIVFLSSSLLIWKRCRAVAAELNAAEKRFWEATLE